MPAVVRLIADRAWSTARNNTGAIKHPSKLRIVIKWRSIKIAAADRSLRWLAALCRLVPSVTISHRGACSSTSRAARQLASSWRMTWIAH